MASPGLDGRVIIVSNRLPVSINYNPDGAYGFTPSSGGLVSGLSGLVKSGIEYLWFGWPGTEVPEDDIPRVQEDLSREYKAVPVLLDRTTAGQYYDGFSNSTVWPLLHNQLDKVAFDKHTLAAYHKANELFADTITPHLKDGDCIWVHDYHLMLLPLLLRQRARKAGVDVRIGWFLHTPFPNEEAFAILPSKESMLRGMLGADAVGFQTDEARRLFLTACSEISDCQPADTMVYHEDRITSVGTFPIGVEPSDFHQRLRTEVVQDKIRSIRAKFQGASVIIGVDRLDYIKGIPQKLHAFNEFLKTNPEWIGRAVLIQVLVPSRANLEMFQNLLASIQKLVGEINGRYGRIDYVPIYFIYNSLSPTELTALYTMADVCFVASTRDGMNLVSYEYVACHNETAVRASDVHIAPGTLVLSQFAGAAGVLGGALVVNPWDPQDCAEALAHAVSMSAVEAGTRMQQLGDTVERQTSRQWGLGFLRALAPGIEEDVSGTSSEDEGLVIHLKKASARLGRIDSVLE